MSQTSLEFIGNTPVYQLDNSNIYVKLEKYNLGGSVKDRAVLGMIQAAQAAGAVTPETIFVEPSSGNTGIAVALLASVLGLKAVVIMPESFSVERRQLIKAYGAQLVLTPKEGGMKAAIAKAEEIKSRYPNAIILSQFDNPANPAYHHQTTGKEILEQVPDLDIFVAGIGTGGTFTGVVEYLNEHKPGVLAVALEPEDSPVISQGRAGAHKIQGIGTGFLPGNFKPELANQVLTISNDEAFAEAKDFIRTTGIGVGISSGAALAGAKKLATQYPDKKIVTILPDGVEKYLSVLDFEGGNYVQV